MGPVRGTLFLVVGASGAGKDTLIDAARSARPDLAIPCRVVTRAADAPGEAVEAVSEVEFARREAAGDFLLSWRAHGLSYAIPGSAGRALADGRDVLANVSRSVVGEARARLQPVRVLLVRADPAVLAGRLAARGRESAAEIEGRIARAALGDPAGPDVAVIRNDGTVEEGAAAFLAALQPVRG